MNKKINTTGYFIVGDYAVKDMHVYVQNDALSLYIEGNYFPKTTYSDITVWGKYNYDVEKKIKIFHIPLSFIYKFVFRTKESIVLSYEKVAKIPSIISDNHNIRHFKVNIKGALSGLTKLNLKFTSLYDDSAP